MGGRMQRARSIEDIQKAIESEVALALYISAPNCNVCDALKPKIENLINENFPKMKLLEANVADIPAVGATYSVFSAPALILFFDHKEFDRFGRNVSLEQLRQRIEKIYHLLFS